MDNMNVVLVLLTVFTIAVVFFILKEFVHLRKQIAENVKRASNHKVTRCPKTLIKDAENSLKASYTTPTSRIKVSKSGMDITKLSPKQQYLVKSFFIQYRKKRELDSTGDINIIGVNHLADSFLIRVSSEKELVDSLNNIFGVKKNVSTYRRMYSKGIKT